MSKYINADELIKAIETELWDWKTVDGIKSSTVLKQTISDIKNMPSANVRENTHGEWIDESDDSLKCSVCGLWVYKPFIGGSQSERTRHYAPNYCAFCGADMRGEKNEIN